MFLLAALFVIDAILVFSSFLFAVCSRVSEKHYFLGAGKPLFTFQLGAVKFSVAWWFPLAVNFRTFGPLGIARVQAIVNSTKQRARQAWEFNEHSILKRLLVTLAPTLLLFTTGVLYSITTIYVTEDSYLSKDSLNVRGIYPSTWGRELGFKRGDKILAINGHDFKSYEEITVEGGQHGSHITVLRDGSKHDIEVKGTPEQLFTEFGTFITPDVPFTILMVRPGYPAENADVIAGDRIISINGKSITHFYEVRELLPSIENDSIELIIERTSSGKKERLTKQLALTEEKQIGFSPNMEYNETTERLSFTEGIQHGVSYAFSQIKSTITILSGKISLEPQRGPIGVVKAYSIPWHTAGPLAVFLAALSLTPFPGTVFWSLLALLLEAMRGKTPGYQSIANAQRYGLYLVGLLFAFVLFSDIIRLIKAI